MSNQENDAKKLAHYLHLGYEPCVMCGRIVNNENLVDGYCKKCCKDIDETFNRVKNQNLSKLKVRKSDW